MPFFENYRFILLETILFIYLQQNKTMFYGYNHWQRKGNGLTYNEYSGIFQHVITIDQLF